MARVPRTKRRVAADNKTRSDKLKTPVTRDGTHVRLTDNMKASVTVRGSRRDGAVKKVVVTRKSTRSRFTTSTNESGEYNKPIESIRDFKKMKGKTYYLVHRTGTTTAQDTWEAEQSIDSLDIVSAFCERVQAASGYTVDNNSTTSSTNGTTGEETPNVRRSTRTSKTRAMLRMTDKQITIESSSDSESDDGIKTSGRRKRSASTSTTRKKRSNNESKQGDKPKRLRGQAARKAAEAEDRQQRQVERQGKSDAAIVDIDETNCCLCCGVRVYRQAVENDDLEKIKAALENKKTVPHWSGENCQHWSDYVVSRAMVKGNKEIVSLLLQDVERDRVTIPSIYTNYGSNTGHLSLYTFGRAVSKVNESRGNRQGNSAFYRSSQRNQLEVDFSRLNQPHSSITIMNALQNTNLDPDMVDHLKDGMVGHRSWSIFIEQKGFYFTVASGNWAVAGAMVERIQYRSGFNHLHENVLTFKDGQPLETYRSNQILKKSYDAFNITPLACAAIHPSKAYLKELFEELTPAERMDTDDNGRTIAHFAAASTTPDCLEYLIEQEFPLANPDKFKLTPLIQAARFGRHRNIRPLLKYLSKGDVPNTEFADQTLLRQRWRPLHYAAYFGHADTCRELIDCGATIEAVESSFRATPLLFAAQRGHVDCVRVLIEDGKADPEAVDKFGRTPLHLASIEGKYDVAKYLLQDVGVNADAADTSHNRPIHYAAGFGYLKLLRLLIEVGEADPAASNVWRTTACSVANLKGHISIVQYLLTKCNVDVNFKDQDGKTLLHHCVEETVTNKLEAEQVLRKARLLISKNADPNIQTVEGDTVLHSFAIGVYNGHKPVGYFEEGDMYCSFQKLKYDELDGIEFSRQMANLLLDAGAKFDIKNVVGDTPMTVAMNYPKHYVMDIFIERGAKYWEAMSSTDLTFFEYLITTASELDAFSTRREMDRIRLTRYKTTVDRIWNSIVNNPVPKGVDTNINVPNIRGYNPLLSAIVDVIKRQKNCVKKEKERFKLKHIHNTTSYSQGAGNANHSSRKEVIFELRFKNFIDISTKVIKTFRPDMNAVVQLPKDFFKTDRKRSKSEYPAWTGYSLLHIAAPTQDPALLEFLLLQGCDPNQRVIIDGVPTGNPPMLTGYFKKKFLTSQYLDNDDLQTVEHMNKIYNIIKPDFDQLLPNAVKQYLSFGANPCVANNDGFSTLMKAAKSLDYIIMENLCTAYTRSSHEGIDNRDKCKRYTALMYAVDAVQDILKDNKDADVLTVKHLLKAGANPNEVYKNGNNGDTVMMKIIRLQYPALMDIVIQNTRYPIDHSIVNNNKETCAIIICKNNSEYISKAYFDLMTNSYELSSFDVNVSDKHHNTALLLASKSGNEHAVISLLKCNANPNYFIPEESKNISPLAQAVQNTYLSIAQRLLEAGANVNYQDDQGLSPLHHAVLVEKYYLVKLMLDFKAKVHAVDKKQRTALHIAIQKTKSMTNASLRTEQLLLQEGSDINAKDILGRTPLHLAFTDMDIVPHMRKMFNIYKKVKKFTEDKKKAEALEKAVARTVQKYGRNNIDSASKDWIARAARTHLESKLHGGLQKKTSSIESNGVFAMDEDTIIIEQDEISTVELYSQFEWEMDSVVASKVDPIDIIKFLSQYDGLQYDTTDKFGRTPLHYAATVGAFSSTSVLLAKGININAQDLDRNTPLHLALRYKHADYSVMLCDQGAIPRSVMTLPVGDSVTTLNYSLSQDFMNMGYLILDRDPNMLESLQDALRTGKFHVADILLNSGSTTALSGITPEGRNLWHIVANFKPFDKEIWDEYLPDVIAKIAELGLPFVADVYQRTPLHYAAMHDQATLLKSLISAGGSKINQLDIYGLSELWYAASSHSVHTVKLLVEAGAHNEVGTSTIEKESALLVAVKSKDINLVKALLEAGVPIDNDSVHGRTNAIMQACMDKSDNILKELLDAGVDPNVPSSAIYYVNGKKKSIITHPVFIATDSTFKVLITGGADANVVSPKEEPWLGRSCFMYLGASGSNKESLMLLLENNANVDLQDLNSDRTIFYHYFFDNTLPNCKIMIDYIMKHSSPNVNIVDPITGMTPLEFSIRKHNSINVEWLLGLGANPNITSCKTITTTRGEDIDVYNWGPINAIFHAIAQNDLTSLQTICSRTKHNIDWKATDNEGHNAVSFLINTNYSHENVDILKFLVETIGYEFDELAEAPDNSGHHAIDYAHAREHKEYYNELVKLGLTIENVEMDAADEINQKEQSMIIDEYIAMQAIEEDAEAERAILEAEAKAQEEANKENIENEDKEKKIVSVVDPASKMEKTGQVLLDENNDPYDILVQKIDVEAYTYGRNMFYKLSVIYNTLLDLYVLWTRWGSFGETGMHQKTPFLTKEEAVAEFKSIFKSKTGNAWENHKPEAFVPTPGRFELILAKPPRKPVILKNFEFVKTSVPSQLPSAIYNSMNIICDFDALNQEYNQLELDIPAGQIPQKRIDEAYEIIDKLDKLIEENKYQGVFTTKEERAKKKDLDHEMVQLSNQYYRLLPKTSHDKGIYAISRKDNLETERGRLNNVNYLNFSINVLLAAKRRASEIHPFDYCFRSLHCQINEIEKNTAEFRMIKKYMLTTSKKTEYEISHLFSLSREGEDARFERHANNKNRKLLWHGSQANNFLGILKQGLRTKPAIAEQTGSMFGNGVYFADMFDKSINYSSNGFYEKKHPCYALLLLSEVALGEECEMSYYAGYRYEEGKHMSVRGMGKQGPNPANAIYDKSGVKIPMGPSIEFPIKNSYFEDPMINHNEFIVYDESQIKLRYMVLVRNNAYCELCQQMYTNSTVPNLSEYKDKSDISLNGHSALGEYENGLIQFWITHSGKTDKELFGEHLDAFLKAESFKPRWNPSMPIDRNSKVCTDCAQAMATMMFVQQAENQLPETFQEREPCQYGEKCTRKNDLNHAKAYKHWFLPDVKNESEKEVETNEHSDSDAFADTNDDDMSDVNEYDY